jgi:hypothetical protein
MSFPSSVKLTLEELGMEILIAEDNWSKNRPELVTLFGEWFRQSMRAGAPPALQRGGKAKDYETMKQKVDKLLRRSDAMLDEDYVLEMVPSTVVARKVG